jgi:hypothetical protein
LARSMSLAGIIVATRRSLHMSATS